jgi:hypothetical protein
VPARGAPVGLAVAGEPDLRSCHPGRISYRASRLPADPGRTSDHDH